MAETTPRHVRKAVMADISTAHPPDGDLESLLCRTARGESAAFAQVYDQTAGAVLGVATRVLRNRAIAEEVAQDTLVEVWRRSPRYDPRRGSAKTWIMTLAHARAVDRVRSEQSASSRELRAGSRDIARPYDEVSERVETSLDRQRVHRCLECLTELQLQSLTLAYYDGYTHREIAVLLDKPLGTVKARIRDGIGNLRDRMTQER